MLKILKLKENFRNSIEKKCDKKDKKSVNYKLIDAAKILASIQQTLTKFMSLWSLLALIALGKIAHA